MESDNFDDAWHTLILQMVEMNASELNELIQFIRRLDAEEIAASWRDGSYTGLTFLDDQKVQQYLERFFVQRCMSTDLNLDEEYTEIREITKIVNLLKDQDTAVNTMESDDFDKTWHTLILRLVKMTSSELNEMIQLICCWDAEECAASLTFVDEQKVRQYMEKFFAQRSVLTEQNCDKDNKEITSAAICPEEEKKCQTATALSDSNTTEITEEATVLKAQVTDEEILTEQSLDTHTTMQAIRKPKSVRFASEAKKPFGKSLYNRLKSVCKTSCWRKRHKKLKKEQNKEDPLTSLSTKSASSSRFTRKTFCKSMKKVWKKRFGKKQHIKLAAKCQEDDTAKERSVSPIYNQMCSPLKDEAFCPYQLFAAAQEFPAEDNEDRVIEIYLPPGSPEEDESTEEKNEPSNDQQLNSCVLSPVIERFFHCLTEEQWRELSEGVYNKDVKEKLNNMCMDILRFSTNSVIKIIQSIHQSSPTSDTCDHNKSLTSEYLKEFFSCNVQSLMESSFSQAVCEVLGADTPVRVSPDFTEAMVAEVLHEVNSVLSDGIQASVDGGSCSTTAPARSQMSRGSPSEKVPPLAGAIKTMKSFLTGRANAVRRTIVAQKDGDTNNGRKEETQTMTTQKGCSTEKKQSVWTMCFSRRQRVQSVPLNLKDHEDMTPSTISKTPEEENGKGLWGCICNIFSKDKKKKKTEKKERKSWTMRLLCF